MLLLLLMAVFLVVPSVAWAEKAAPDRPPAAVEQAPDEVTAAVAAARQGKRVEVADQRTATSTVYVEPNGTRTTEMTATPTRFKRGNDWLPLDRTLAPRADGSVASKSVAEDVALSGGGGAPFIRMASGANELALYWPTALPKPVLEGTAATYAEVLPGIDLVVRAESTGYQQLLVVKTAAAAKNPALAKVRIRVAAKGLRVTVDDSGALKAVDEKGAPVFGSASSTMWDSKARVEMVGVELAGDVLTLIPNQAFLADESTVYPVTVDPAYFPHAHNYWATVLSGPNFANQAYNRRSADPVHPDWAQVGQCWNGRGECNSIGEARAYFSFHDTGQLAGKDILEAKFYSTVKYSPSCDVRQHQLRMVHHAIGDGTTWNNKPENPHQWIEFPAPNSCNGAHGVELDIRGLLNTGGASTYYLHAVNGGDQLAWRKYASAETRISIKWNRKPNVPSNLRTDPPLPQPCRWCAGIPYMSNQDIQLIATISDPDNDRVRPKWRVQPTGRPEEADDGDFVPSDTPVSRGLSLADKDGLQISWWLHAEDEAPAVSAETHGQVFAVDRTKVPVAPTVDSKIYTVDNEWHGGVGVPDVFTFGSNGVGDIDHYLYGWQSPPTTKVDATSLGGLGFATIAPPADGRQTLFVQSVDRAGNKSVATATHVFNVRAGDGARGQWSFEGNAKDNAYLGDRHGQLNGGASYSSGAVGTGLLLDGNVGSNMMARSAMRTDSSFSVSAWARPDSLSRPVMGVVSQDSESGYSGWLLHYRDDGQGPKWAFWLPGGNPSKPGDGMVVEGKIAAHEPQVGRWTHLTGVFDRNAAEVRLYADGALIDKKATPPGWVPWQASGHLAIGRLQWAGSNQMHPWAGAIDEVQTFDRALSDAEVSAKVSRDNVRAGHWKFDDQPTPDGNNTKARNEIASGSDGTLVNGASFEDHESLGRAVKFDREGAEHVVTGGPAVRTDRSLTISAWVKAEEFVTGGKSMTAVSQDGAFNSGFYLQYNSEHNKWIFLKFSHDIADGDPLRWHGVIAKQPVVLKDWVHLTGVYDAVTKEMRIYVNGELGNDQKFVYPGTDWNATGKLVIGRGKFNGVEADFWPGSVDEVRIYNRVLSAAEIHAAVWQNLVSAGSWKLDGNVNDSSGRGLTGTWTGTPAYTEGYSENPDTTDQALRLTGSNGVEAPSAVNTMQSYSVSAWVRPDVEKDCVCTVLSQDFGSTPAFSVSGTIDGKWRMAAFGNTGSATAGKMQAGVWTHLTGVYSNPRQQFDLYVNGALVASLTNYAPQHNNGKLQIGQTRKNGVYGDRFTGTIDDVQVYSRALFADEVRVMAGRDMTLVHNWKLNDSPADSIGARAGTAVGGATYGPGRAGKSARLDGVDDAVSASGVDVRTDQSFTVSSWVNLTRPGPCDSECTRDAVSLSGGADNKGPVKFRLGHRIDQDQAQGNGKWIFELPEANGAVTKAAVSVRPSQFDNWVLLVGMYDASSGQIDLFVYNDDPLSEPDHDTGRLIQAWQGKGALQIGRAVTGPNATATEYWPGGVDDVRLYTGTLPADRLKALRSSYPAVTS